MALADGVPTEPEHHALFPWFPPHRVHSSDDQLRSEALLANIPLFKEIPRARLRAIAHVARRNAYQAGQVVIRMGAVGSTLHVIRHGLIHVVRDVDHGDPIVLASLGPGEFFGELSLFDRGPRSATIVAADETETLSLGRSDILDIMNRYPEVALAFLGSLCERLRSTDNLLENASRGGLTESAS